MRELPGNPIVYCACPPLPAILPNPAPDLDAAVARLQAGVRFAMDEALPLYKALQALTNGRMQDYAHMFDHPASLTLSHLSCLQEDLFSCLDKDLLALERLVHVANVAAKSYSLALRH